jgi:sugar phosphate isomerase/epimerase
MNNAIFGYTGLVGSYLNKYYMFKYLYNSENINQASNKTFDTIFISCIPAIKWLANKNPENDNKIIETIKNIFRTITANKVILISTIDIYNIINNRSNESTTIDNKNNNTYGKNRYLFENFIRKQFENVIIIRLPALFGSGLKKNIIYDLLNSNEIDKIYINSSFQWYNLEWLKEDIDICINNNIKECNLFTEPLPTSKIIELFPKYDYTNNPKKYFNYDSTTINEKYFQFGRNGYIRDKELVYDSLKNFILREKKERIFKLCVSNISNNSLENEQYYNILKHYGIKYIEIAPTKFGNWDDLFNNNFKIDKQLTAKFELQMYSFQSITYTIQNNIFDENNTQLLEHLKKVIDLAIENNVKNLVFGCPKNRKILNNNDNIDSVFINFFKNLGDYIGNRQLTISIENNSVKYDCNYLNTISEVGNIVTKIDHPNIKMMIDIGNCIMDNDNIDDLIMYKNLINHIHISTPFMKPFINCDKKEYLKFINLLNIINYDKIISLEFLNNGENELENLNKSLKNFIELFE